MSQSIELVVNFEILDFDIFSDAAQKCTDYTREHEPETLAYEWFVDPDKTRGSLFEQYASEAAFRKHVTGPVFSELGIPLVQAIRWTAYQSFGPLPEEFRKMLGRIDAKNWENRLFSIRHR